MITKVVMTVLLIMPIALGSLKVLGIESKGYKSDNLNNLFKNGSKTVFFVVAAEEVVARFLFIGVLGGFFNKFVIESQFWFYFFFLIGNALWALVHLSNYEDGSKKPIKTVAPQFIAGLGFGFIYMSYGLTASVMAHYLYNAVLFSSMKEELPRDKDVRVFIYYSLSLIIGFLLLKNSYEVDLLPTLFSWLDSGKLSGYSYSEYLLVLFTLDAILAIFGGIILFDNEPVNLDDVKKVLASATTSSSSLVGILIVFLVIAAISTMITFVISFLLSLPINFFFTGNDSNLVFIAFITTIVVTFLEPVKSGSSLGKLTIVKMIGTFFSVLAFLSLGFWYGFALNLGFTFLHLPAKILASESKI